MLPDFKLYYKGMVITAVWYWHKNKHTDEWSRKEDPKINLCTYDSLIYDRRARNEWGKESLH